MKPVWVFVPFAIELFLFGCSGKTEAPAPTQPTVAIAPQPPPPPGRQIPLSEYRKVEISIKGKRLSAYVADDEAKEREGLMFVNDSELGPNEAMVFVFPDEAERAFWMKDTPVPLDIAFVRADGKIASILTMKPLDESRYPSDAPAKFAVEAHAGWFSANGIKVGDRFDFSALK
jgi:uncharacterized membrane protein (UPF0127 family)